MKKHRLSSTLDVTDYFTNIINIIVNSLCIQSLNSDWDFFFNIIVVVCNKLSSHSRHILDKGVLLKGSSSPGICF